jgi:hypothetical protein
MAAYVLGIAFHQFDSHPLSGWLPALQHQAEALP